jgi:hypothetical protein
MRVAGTGHRTLYSNLQGHSIDSLFEAIKRIKTRTAYFTCISYHPEFGFPDFISVDMGPLYADGFYGQRILDFKVFTPGLSIDHDTVTLLLRFDLSRDPTAKQGDIHAYACVNGRYGSTSSISGGAASPRAGKQARWVPERNLYRTGHGIHAANGARLPR